MAMAATTPRAVRWSGITRAGRRRAIHSRACASPRARRKRFSRGASLLSTIGQQKPPATLPVTRLGSPPMSLDQVRAVLLAARDRPTFAHQLAQAPAILTGYDLTVEERRALVEYDVEALDAMGVEADLVGAASVIGRPR